MIGIGGISTYVAPILVSVMTAKPLHGNFDMKGSCACGHEMFLFLGREKIYLLTPAHHEIEELSVIERSKESVTVLTREEEIPAFQIHHDDRPMS